MFVCSAVCVVMCVVAGACVSAIFCSLVGGVSVEVCAPLLASSDPIRSVLVSRRTRRLTRHGSLVGDETTRHPLTADVVCAAAARCGVLRRGSGRLASAGHVVAWAGRGAGRGGGAAGRAGRKYDKTNK